MENRAWWVLFAALAVLGGCARQVEVVTDPAVGRSATLVVGNQTEWTVLIELQPSDEPGTTFTLGQVPPEESVAFENVPSGRALALRASVLGSTRMLTGPVRTFQPGERWEWLLRPGDAWRVP